MLASRAASSLLGRYSPRSIRDRFAMDVPTAAAASPSFMPAASRALRNGEDSVLGSDISPILDGPCANRNVLHITLCDKRFAVHAGIANNSRMGERLATVGLVVLDILPRLKAGDSSGARQHLTTSGLRGSDAAKEEPSRLHHRLYHPPNFPTDGACISRQNMYSRGHGQHGAVHTSRR